MLLATDLGRQRSRRTRHLKTVAKATQPAGGPLGKAHETLSQTTAMKVKTKQTGWRKRAGLERWLRAKGLYCSLRECEFSSQHPRQAVRKQPVTSSGRCRLPFWSLDASPLTDITTCTSKERKNNQTGCLHFASSGITGVRHHTWYMWCWDGIQDLMHTRQVSFQYSYIGSHSIFSLVTSLSLHAVQTCQWRALVEEKTDAKAFEMS